MGGNEIALSCAGLLNEAKYTHAQEHNAKRCVIVVEAYHIPSVFDGVRYGRFVNVCKAHFYFSRPFLCTAVS